MKHLHVDIETYSSVDLKNSGAYKYADSFDFEILCVAWSYGEVEYVTPAGKVYKVYVCEWKDVPAKVKRDLQDPKVTKYAHNATFERTCFAAVGLDVGYNWICTAVLAGYNGLPMSLENVSLALDLGDKAKSAAGKALIRYFCVPVKPTKVNGGRTRNLSHHDPEKWAALLEYCRQDVVAEMGVADFGLDPLPEWEQYYYEIDQMINEGGVRVDRDFIYSVLRINDIDRERMTDRAIEITGLSNPNSNMQLRKWIGEQTGEEITSLTKNDLADFDFEDQAVMELVSLRKKLSRTSISKYAKMLGYIMEDDRIRGLLQFYGAWRTGRWAGRGVQVQNLARNYMKDLDNTRKIAREGDYDLLCLLFDDVQDALVQLIRTAFVPSEGATHFTTSDYTAIEARVLAWLSGEKWRMRVFRSNEKRDIYKESASAMFGVPVEQIDSEGRQKGKIAELALGYQGGHAAITSMEVGTGQSTGLDITGKKALVKTWRKANKSIVDFWYALQDAAEESVRMKKKVTVGKFTFETNNQKMTILLPSGRKLSYWGARMGPSRFNREEDCIKYLTEENRKWVWTDTYGGKLAENVTQAVARDFMAEAVAKVHERGHRIVMHVHDEIVIENGNKAELEAIMKELPSWAPDFPLEAKGEEVKYYQK